MMVLHLTFIPIFWHTAVAAAAKIVSTTTTATAIWTLPCCMQWRADVMVWTRRVQGHGGVLQGRCPGLIGATGRARRTVPTIASIIVTTMVRRIVPIWACEWNGGDRATQACEWWAARCAAAGYLGEAEMEGRGLVGRRGGGRGNAMGWGPEVVPTQW